MPTTWRSSWTAKASPVRAATIAPNPWRGSWACPATARASLSFYNTFSEIDRARGTHWEAR